VYNTYNTNITLQVDQELYFDQLQSIVSLLKLLTKENEKHEPEGFFTVEEFSKILSQYLENKVTSEEIEGLMTAAQLELNDTDQSDEGIEFTRLFFEVICNGCSVLYSLIIAVHT